MKKCNSCGRTYSDMVQNCPCCGVGLETQEVQEKKIIVDPGTGEVINQTVTQRVERTREKKTNRKMILFKMISILSFVIGISLLALGMIPDLFADERIIGDRGAVLLTGLTTLSFAVDMLAIKSGIQTNNLKSISAMRKIAIVINVVGFGICVGAGCLGNYYERLPWFVLGCVGLGITWALRIISGKNKK